MKKEFPTPLQKGDKIAIVSPSGAVDVNLVKGAANRLKDWGYEPIIISHACGVYGRYSGTEEDRISDMQWAINNPEIKAILCGRGGYGAIQIVDKIDFDPFIKNPKWLIGFSDITVFHAQLSTLEIPSIHAIMARGLTENKPDDPSVLMLKDILEGHFPSYGILPHPLNKNGQATGILTGGNLSVLYGLRGTKYDIEPDGKILFIEDLAEKPYHIDRMMQNLRLGGVLEKLSGLIVGQFTEIEEDLLMFKTVYEIIADAVSGYDYPVCFNFPAGHIDRNYPLIMNAEIKLNITENEAIVKCTNQE